MTHISLKLVSSLLLAVAVLLPAAPAAAGDTGPTPAVKAEFKKTCSQRTRLVRQLAKLDNQAAEAVAAGEDPVEIHAQQTAVQDELDLVQLRLEIHTPWLVGLTPLQLVKCLGTEWFRVTEKEMSTSGHPT